MDMAMTTFFGLAAAVAAALAAAATALAAYKM
jgi:hypothetical protein